MSQFILLFNAAALGVLYLCLAALLTKKSRIHPNQWLLAGFLFCFSARLYVNLLLLDADIAHVLYPILLIAPTLLLLTAPLIYLFVRNVLGNSTLKPKDALFALPALAQAVDLFPHYVVTPEAKNAMLFAISSDASEAFERMDGLFMPGEWVLPVRLVFTIPFLLLSIRVYTRHRAQMDGLAQSPRSVVWLGLFLALIIVFVVSNLVNPALIPLVLNIQMEVAWMGLMEGLMIHTMTGPLMVIAVASLVLLNPETLFIVKSNGLARVIQSSALRDTVQALDSLFDHDPIYLMPKLRLADVADRLEIDPSDLSQALNMVLGENFNAYVNRWRVQHAKRSLDQGQHLSSTIAGIGHASGFASKTSFYNAFKRIEGMTPSDYLESTRGD